MPRTSPHRNRVAPSGEIVPIAQRGAWTGNRGILHRNKGSDDDSDGGAEIVRQHAGKAWIVCLLRFRGRRIPQWAPGHYTPLFFLDEAVAFAAGHRPCAQCRRTAFRGFLDALARGLDGGAPAPARAPDLDRLLDGQRRIPRTSRRRWHDRTWRELPDGAFVVHDDAPVVVIGDAVVAWSPTGYSRARPRPATGHVLTPPATLTVLAGGYPVQIDPGALARAGQDRSSTAESSSATEE